MGFDPRYISHCYYIMENLVASSNDTILVINRSITGSEVKHGNLGIRVSEDSSILGYVDSKHMVKNICTSQKCIFWSYFLTFIANQSIHFGTKVIRKLLELVLEG